MLSENNDPPNRKRNLDQGVPTGLHASPEKCSPPTSDISTFIDGQMDIQRLLGSIDMGVWAIDAGDNTLFLNEAMADMLKYKVDEIAGKNILDFVPEEYRDDAKRFWQRGREGASTQQELQLQCKDGTPCHAIVSASAAVDAGGRLMYSLGFFTDITEHKLMGDTIGDRLERYRILIENTNDLIWEVNSDYVYTYLNPRIYDILGYRLEDVIGKKIFNIMPPEEAAKAEDIFHMLENKKVPSFKVEIVCKHHDGHTVYIEISGRPIKDEHGVFRGWRGGQAVI
jgi:PAS domain S-box-containing protein